MNATVGRRNALTVAPLLGLLLMMGTLVYYSVPLYRLFCQVTGYAGTTQRAARAPGATSGRVITVRFNADISARLPWRFEPAQNRVTVRVGEEILVHYVARNNSDRAVTGSAIFNVSPAQAGQYFAKIDCFCFTEQTLAPGQRVDMPVLFFIDPEIENDRELDGISTITLSYTFYPTRKTATRGPVKPEQE